eukprot:12300605-Ditylum_brightwellii.AAC.1
MVGFVYDAMGKTNKFYNNNATQEELIQLMQHDAQLWSDLLWVSGGILELDKCSCHFIYYCFLADGTPIMMSKRPDPQLQVRKYNSSEAVTIKYKNLFTSHKKLGHYKLPGSSNITQQKMLEKNANEYSVKAQISVLAHSESQRYYDSCYLKSVEYVLGQCFFEKEICRK